MRLILTGILAMPARGLADIYMQKDNSQQIVLTNLAPDVDSVYETLDQRHQGTQRFVLLIESDLLEIKKGVEPRNAPKINYDGVSRQLINDAITSAARETTIDPALLHAVIHIESNYNPNALSRQGAQGLMQLMPSTVKRFNVRNAYDATQNILGGAKYLRELHILFNGNLPLMLAAYNAGPKAVTKYGMKIPPYIETRLYVPKVLHLYKQLLAKRSNQVSSKVRD